MVRESLLWRLIPFMRKDRDDTWNRCLLMQDSFLGQMEKPDVESIEGLSPAISIDQKSTNRNPRSTVGTVTEIYDYLRLLYARIGIPHCPKCGKRDQEADGRPDGRPDYGASGEDEDPASGSCGPWTERDEHEKVLDHAKKSGYVRVRIDGNHV